MTQDNETKIFCAFLIAMGLVLNGCDPRQSIMESEIIDEREIAKGIVEGACYLNGRNYQYGECK